MWMAWLLAGWAQAASPDLPSYRNQVVVAYWTALDARITASCQWPRGAQGMGVPLVCRDKDLEEAIAAAQQFLTHVADDGRIHYLIGLAQRHLGQTAAAIASFEAAVQRDPTRAEAWFDLGELRANQQRWDDAATAFTHVTTLLPEGPQAWAGWLQLAQVDAHMGRAEAFEEHLRQALRWGFTFQMVAHQEAWKGFYADPTIHDVLDRMLSVYATPDVRGSLRPEAD